MTELVVTLDPERAVGLDQKLGEYAAALQQLLDQEEAEIAAIEASKRVHEQAAKKIRSAIAALTQAAPKKPGPKPGPKPKKPPAGVSEQIVGEVYEALKQAGDNGLTLQEAMEATKRSHDPVRKAFATLRERELVRRAGSRPETRAHIFKLMPDGS